MGGRFVSAERFLSQVIARDTVSPRPAAAAQRLELADSALAFQ